jgi:hypothetical protein
MSIIMCSVVNTQAVELDTPQRSAYSWPCTGHGGIWETGGIAPRILTPALDECKCSLSHLGFFIPGKEPSLSIEE